MTGWQFLCQKIVSYLNHYMSAMLTGQQQSLFALEKHLQIYVSTTDKGFHKVLHAWSYKRTFMELHKYIKQEYHPSNAFEIRTSFFSPAFLPCLSVHRFDPQDEAKNIQDVSQASVAAAFPKPPTSVTLSQDPRETAGMEDITTPSRTESVTWMPFKDSPPPPNESLQPRHPGFQNVPPLAWRSPPIRSPNPYNVIHEENHARDDTSPYDGSPPASAFSPIFQNSLSQFPESGYALASQSSVVLDLGPSIPHVPEEIYGSHFFIRDYKHYSLRQYWLPEKLEQSNLPPFTADTTAFRWYEKGVYLPPYHCLKLHLRLGSSWMPLTIAFPESIEQMPSWSIAICGLLQKLVDAKEVTHPVPGVVKFVAILASSGKDGHKAFHCLMEYHASQLNHPLLSKVQFLDPLRMKSASMSVEQ
jgi:hypothetical protein